MLQELFVSDNFYRERWELVAYSLAVVCFAVLIGVSLYRLRPVRPRLRWRLATAMLIIALVAIEYSLAVSAWDLKDKWNQCFTIADYWARDPDKVAPENCQECRDRELERNEKEQKYRHFLWNPWMLIFLTRDELNKTVNEDGRNVRHIHVPIQANSSISTSSADPLLGTGSR
jgi:hypothetical protein